MTSQRIVTEAVVLRSMRYGEADRILHVYTQEHGRLSAIAKGVRKTKSRFGGRLEPLARVELVLHRGRGDMWTVQGAQTVHPHARLRTDARQRARLPRQAAARGGLRASAVGVRGLRRGRPPDRLLRLGGRRGVRGLR